MPACRRLDVDPTRTVFVDDAQIAVDGAAAVRMTTVLHHDTRSTIARVCLDNGVSAGFHQ
ncbi:hypothetical protein [Rhodococcus sp. 311R]|uniref:hypothetical protein n=1 Tax=Rhodococcus sp. 311R TaxID=1617904 RepID=UPI001EE742F7|nr:hypothetical protein [Rhodococcus sp. 311R]